MIGGAHISVGMTDAMLRYHDDDWTPDFFSRHQMSIRVRTSRLPDGSERELWIDAIRRLLTDCRSDEVWIPLGGPHTDHILTADACFAVFRSDPALMAGRAIRIYSEFPYAARFPRHMSRAVDSLADCGAVLEKELISIDGVSDQKRRLSSLYDSQDIEEMRPDTEASARINGATNGSAEALWTVKELPDNLDSRGIASSAAAKQFDNDAIRTWLNRNQARARVRVLLPVPTGRWPQDFASLRKAFPKATFEIYTSSASRAEVDDVPADLADIRQLSTGIAAWLILSLRLAFSFTAAPTLFHAGDRRLRQAKLLSLLWPRSDTIIVSSMDAVVGLLQPGPRQQNRSVADLSVGVVVIGRNEGARLLRCLESVICETTNIVYVDSGSSDGSVALAKSKGVRTVELDSSIPFSAARARNAGFDELLRSDPNLQLVQFVDGDCDLCGGWLEGAASFLNEHPTAAVVSGRLREKYPDHSIYNTLCDMEWNVPAGEVKDCGGIAMMRARAFQSVRGFRIDLIAGEEPELCVRLRKQGWHVWRLTQDMSWHDSAMTRFSQWWKREQRAGHAFAQGAELHGAEPEKHYVREFRSALFWGLIVPLFVVALSSAVGPIGLWALLIFPLQIVRLAVQGNRSTRDNWLRAVFLVMGKFPEMLGELRFFGRRTLGLQSRLIEYK